jgi:uncharacterized protein (TIGR02722 family)
MFGSRKAVMVLALMVIFGLTACPWVTKRADPNEEVLPTHEFNPKDMQLIGAAVDKLLEQNVLKPGKPVLYMADIRNLTNDHIAKEMIRDNIAARISRSGRIRMVVRGPEHEEALKEIDFQRNAMMDRTTVKRLGKQIGADYFLQGKLTNIVNKVGRKKVQFFYFTLVLVDVETLESHMSSVQIQKLSKRPLFGG